MTVAQAEVVGMIPALDTRATIRSTDLDVLKTRS